MPLGSQKALMDDLDKRKEDVGIPKPYNLERR